MIHRSEIVPSVSRMLLVNDVEPEKQIGRREINLQSLVYHVEIEPRC